MKINQYQQVWQIWASSKDKLYRYILSRFKDKELAQETTQEIVLKLHQSCCSGKEIKNLDAWLFKIGHNTSLALLSKRKKEAHLPKDDLGDENNIWLEMAPLLKPLMNLLPEKYAVPLNLSDIEGMPQKVIAHQLSLPLSTTKSRIQRARVMLKTKILQYYDVALNKKGIPVSIQEK